jgi:hypothetical protein
MSENRKTSAWVNGAAIPIDVPAPRTRPAPIQRHPVPAPLPEDQGRKLTAACERAENHVKVANKLLESAGPEETSRIVDAMSELGITLEGNAWKWTGRK